MKIQNLKYYIGERLLLDIPTLTIPDNSRVGIVGNNGSGKTTLLKLIATREGLADGVVLYQGQVAAIEQFIDGESRKSGGEQTKEKISKSISQDSSILLADEPTNHLDSEGRSYLIRELNRYQGIVLTVSHDRDFLNQICDQIIEIDSGVVTEYVGNYDAYLAQKKVAEKEHERKYDNYVREKERLSSSVRELHHKSAGIKKAPKRMGNSEARLHTRGKGTLAQGTVSRQAHTLENRLEKLEKVEKPWQKKELVIPFSEGQKIHKQYVIESEKLSLSIEGKELLQDTELKVQTGKRTALVGANGVGKTTLLKAILSNHNSLTISQKAKFAYFSQSFNQLEEDKSIIDNVQSTSIHDSQVARDLLAHLLFRGRDVEKKVSVLSGGERTKVAIAKLILGESNVLILDEPTNHLDIESLEVLEESLKAYQGTILFVSHDPYFVKQVAQTTLEIKNKQVTNLNQTKKNKKRNVKKENKMVLEMRKTMILSELSFVSDEKKKLALEEELKKLGEQLKEI